MRVSVTLSPRAHSLLSKDAERRGSSLAEVIRRAAEHYSDKHISVFSAESPWYFLRGDHHSWVLESRDGRVQLVTRLGTALPQEKGARCVCCAEVLVAPGAGDFQYFDREAGAFRYVCAVCADMLHANYRYDQALA